MFKNENGFSLVELAIAAGLAVALAATAVTVLSGTTASLSSKANGAAGTSTTYNSDVLANASGAVSAPVIAAAPLVADLISGYSPTGHSSVQTWSESYPVLVIDRIAGTYKYSTNGIGSSGYSYTPATKVDIVDKATFWATRGNPSAVVETSPNVYFDGYITFDFSDPYKLIVSTGGVAYGELYKVDASGNVVAW